MKSISKSMNPDEAAQAFFGQNDEAFAEMLKKLTANDPRLTDVFQRTRKRFLESKNT
ncbi:MAG: hypothetical protein ACSHXW_16855 [Yoonia sp.]|jgi:hypothetical protein